MANVLVGIYIFAVVGLTYFALHRLKMVYLCARKSSIRRRPDPSWQSGHPKICIQCPLFNEPLVAEGLLKSVMQLRWPGQLEVQILDDSTDHTPAIIDRWLASHPQPTPAIYHIRREHRGGYKAGALVHGMNLTDAEFIAIFDADFRPKPDFFEHLMPYFSDPNVGVVQARWEFNNRRASLLTWLQSVILDIHFVIEQTARSDSGLFFNFNGTAGIWRRKALEEGGSWSADTVTEDLDASYRAQRIGWLFIYLQHYAVPSELPESLTAFKSQQRRWTKGGIQVARRQLLATLRSRLPSRVKIEAFSHLTIGAAHLFNTLFGLILVPYLCLIGAKPWPGWQIAVNAFAVVVLVGVPLLANVFSLRQRSRSWTECIKLILLTPLLIAFGSGMSLLYSAAFFEGLVTVGGEFIRTPKGGAVAKQSGLLKTLSGRKLLLLVNGGELLVGIGTLAAALYLTILGKNISAIVLGISGLGFLWVATSSLLDLFPLASFLRVPRPLPAPSPQNQAY